MSKISPDAVETTLKIGTNNLQNNTYFDRPPKAAKKKVTPPPSLTHFGTLGGGNDFGVRHNIIGGITTLDVML